MGVVFICNDIDFGCSYSYWDKIRTNIIKATIDYIQDKFEKDKELYGHLTIDDENCVCEGSIYYCYMSALIELKTLVLSQKQMTHAFGITIDNTVNNVVKWSSNLEHKNALNKFDIGGLYALCNQTDCDGYYTPGNSLDICSLLDRIEPFVKKYSCYSCIYSGEDIIQNTVYEVFENSYKTMTKVSIC